MAPRWGAATVVGLLVVSILSPTTGQPARVAAKLEPLQLIDLGPDAVEPNPHADPSSKRSLVAVPTISRPSADLGASTPHLSGRRARALNQIQIESAIATNGTGMDVAVAAIVAILTSELAGKRQLVDTAVLHVSLDFLQAYTDAIDTTVANTNVSAEHRTTSIRTFTEDIAAIATAFSLTAHPTTTAALAVTASLLQSARLLATVTTCNTSSAVIPLPSSTAILGGFIQAISLSGLGADVLVSYPPSEVESASAMASRLTRVGINVSALARSASLTTVQPLCGVNAGTVAVSVTEFGNDALFPSNSTTRVRGNSKARIGSSVLSVSLGDAVSDSPYDDPICGTFDYQVNLDTDPTWTGSTNAYSKGSSPHYATPKCVVYDHAQSGWSQNLCTLVGDDGTHATCCCTQITQNQGSRDVTALAVLVSGDVLETVGYHMTLHPVTYTGLALALVTLLVTVVVVLLTPERRSPLQENVLVNLVATLGVAELLFLAVDAPDAEIEPCATISGLLTFAVLSSFAWMNVQGHHLWRLVEPNAVVDANTEATLLKGYALFTVGIPLIVTLVAVSGPTSDSIISSVSISTSGYVIHSTAGNCWVDTKSSTKWFVLAPMLLSVLVSAMFALRVVSAGRVKLRRWWDEPQVESEPEPIEPGEDAMLLLGIASLGCVGWALAFISLFGIGGDWPQAGFAVMMLSQAGLIFWYHVLRNAAGTAVVLALMGSRGYTGPSPWTLGVAPTGLGGPECEPKPIIARRSTSYTEAVDRRSTELDVVKLVDDADYAAYYGDAGPPPTPTDVVALVSEADYVAAAALRRKTPVDVVKVVDEADYEAAGRVAAAQIREADYITAAQLLEADSNPTAMEEADYDRVGLYQVEEAHYDQADPTDLVHDYDYARDGSPMSGGSESRGRRQTNYTDLRLEVDRHDGTYTLAEDEYVDADEVLSDIPISSSRMLPHPHVHMRSDE
jgi:hypothetical protein